MLLHHMEVVLILTVFFEIIYIKSISIVKKTNTVFDKLYEIFPCLIINELTDITEELLNSNLDI